MLSTTIESAQELSQSNAFTAVRIQILNESFIPIRSCQKFSKQICLWDLAQNIGILSIIQIVEAI